VLKKLQCKVYDESGKEMSSLSKDLMVDVKVQVAKEVLVTLVIKGKPAADFTNTMRIVNPEKVLITGPAEVLSKISELKTQPVSIEKLSKTMETDSMIILPSGVKLVDMPREVAVSVVIEPLSEKRFVIAKDNITLTNMGAIDTFNYLVKTESIDVGIKAPKDALNSFNIKDVNPSVDVEGLTEGIHKLPLLFNLPEDVKLDKEYFVEVEVQRVPTVQ
jgi:YbbR domain-containing protein